MSLSPTAASATVTSAADRATDAALAKATQRLAADRKTQAAVDVIRTDQQAVVKATKAAANADQAATAGTSGVNTHA